MFDRVDSATRVHQLRLFGTDRTFSVPEHRELLIGSGSECAVRLTDDDAIAARHVRLTSGASGCMVEDLAGDGGSGVWLDGVRVQGAELPHGGELRLGRYTFIAESGMTIALRSVLERLVGFGERHWLAIDRTMRGVRGFTAGDAVLALCGRGNLVRIAARLHRAVLGTDAPFVVLGRDARIEPALRTSVDGTLCLTARQLASGLETFMKSARGVEPRIRLMICAPTTKAAAMSLQLGSVCSVSITPLEARHGELARIVEECSDDAAVELGQAGMTLDRRDRRWLRGRRFRTFSELDETIRRLVALRTLGVTAGAARLEITHSALSRWAHRRSITRGVDARETRGRIAATRTERPTTE